MTQETVKHCKSKAFYDEFFRKGEGDKQTHYCPGCGHGIVHKLIAEATSDLGVNDRVVFCSPVGCSVFAYYYFDYGNIQCAHGRAPAVATGIRRVLDDSIVIVYQGDGDLAGIGMGAIMHAANRGENMSVFFVNNAIYGMTGGQMAPTTLIGQRTMTSPSGRSLGNEGFPIGMCELMDALKTPVYVERVSLGDAGRVLKARTAIRKAVKYQNERRGFTFVEILSPCPVNWKMQPEESRRWLMENMEPVFPVKQFRDRAAEAEPRAARGDEELSDSELLELFSSEGDANFHTDRTGLSDPPDQLVKIAGFGGQGVMSAGILLANCAVCEGLNATWIPSYGAEMRGGTANASVIVSASPIGNPVVSEPNVLIAMNLPSLKTFEQSVLPSGMILVNSSLVDSKVGRGDVRAFYIPATEIANKLGSVATANVIAMAAYACLSGAVSPETLKQVIPLSIKKKNLIEVNLAAVDEGVKYYKENMAGR